MKHETSKPDERDGTPAPTPTPAPAPAPIPTPAPATGDRPQRTRRPVRAWRGDAGATDEVDSSRPGSTAPATTSASLAAESAPAGKEELEAKGTAAAAATDKNGVGPAAMSDDEDADADDDDEGGDGAAAATTTAASGAGAPRRIRIRDRAADRSEREHDPNIVAEQPSDAPLFRHMLGEDLRAMHKDGKFYQATVCTRSFLLYSHNTSLNSSNCLAFREC